MMGLFSEMAELMRSLPKKPVETQFVLTPTQVHEVRHAAKQQGVILSSNDFVIIPPLSDRIRTRKIIQKDRFIEYEPSDMDWAEPAGLAEWQTVDRESVILSISAKSYFEQMSVMEL